MVHVEEWYKKYSMNFPQKKFVKSVYLATDEPKVVSAARKKSVEIMKLVLCKYIKF